MAGMTRARAPVARITALAVKVRSPPAESATTTPGAEEPAFSDAAPLTTSILFFFIRKATPAESCLATLRERSTMAPKS